MGTTKTFKTLDFGAGGAFEPTANNFPAAKHFFKCTEQSGLTLTDSIGSVVLQMTAMTFPDAYSVTPTQGTPADFVSSGSWVEPLTKPFAVITCANTGIAAMTIGSGSNDIISINGIGLGSQVFADGTTKTAAALTGGAIRTQGITCDIAADELISFEYDTTNDYVAKTPTGTLTFATVDSIDDQGTASGTSFASVYGILIMHFTTLPDDFDVATAWMHHNWQIGNKWIWPAWKGLT